MEVKKFLTLSNFTKELGRNKTGTIHVKAKDLVELIIDRRPNCPYTNIFNPKAPIEIPDDIQRTYDQDDAITREVFKNVQKGIICNGMLDIAYDYDNKKFLLINGQHRFFRLLEILKGVVSVPSGYYWNGECLHRETFSNLPPSLQQALENVELILNFVAKPHKDIPELFIALNNSQKQVSASAKYHAEHWNDPEYQKCFCRSRQSYTKIYSETEKTAMYLHKIYEYMANNNVTAKNIITYNNYMDANVERLYRRINPKNKPVKRDTCFVGFIYFYAMACMKGKEKNVNKHIGDFIDFFNLARKYKGHKLNNTPHIEIVNYANIDVTTDEEQWEKKGEYLYNYMHAKFSQDF